MYSHGEIHTILLACVVVFCPTPSWEHFIWPLTTCLLADLCNHTWVTECGYSNVSYQRRLFIDDCDMIEYNCDHDEEYVAIELRECYRQTCPPWPGDNALRLGNYRYNGKKMIYDPAGSYKPPANCIPYAHGFYSPRILRTTAIPNLPKHMMQGKRRYTPEKEIRRQLQQASRAKKVTNKRTTNKSTTKKTKKPTTKHNKKIITNDKPKQRNNYVNYDIPTFRVKRTMRTKPKEVIQNITVLKDGKIVRKIVRGYKIQ